MIRPARELEAPYRTPAFEGPIELRLDGNEGAAPPASLLEVCSDPELLRRYPDASALEALIAGRLGVEPERVLVTAGADDALDRFCRVFLCQGRELLAPVPTFEMLLRYARLAGGEVVEVPWEGDFPMEALLSRVGERTAAVAVVSPNNPTGAVASVGDLHRLAKLDAMLLVDCAYTEFADEDLSAAAIALPNAVVTRTFSKAWGLAGLRVGYAVGPAEAIRAMRAAGAPYPVAATSLAIAARWLEIGSGQAAAFVERIHFEREALHRLLCELGVEARPSQANFVLARFRDAAFVRSCLASLGIAVRSFPGRPGLGDALRISLPGDPARFERLCGALRTALAPEALLLDLDGVLADVSNSFRACIVETAARWNVSLSPEEIAACKAEGDANNDWIVTRRLLARRGVDVPLQEVIEVFEAIYQGRAEVPGRWRKETPIVAAQVVRDLAARLPLAIVTGRPRRDALRFLEAFELLPSIAALVGMEDASAQPDPAPVLLALRQLGVSRAWMVGDTPDDVAAASAAGVIAFGVVAPGDDRERARGSLLAAGAASVLSCVTDLLETLP